jgi:5-(aminomethyl)-3-furanmethanol phosphate kinase
VIRVAKVGGSLLSLGDFPQRLQAFTQPQSEAPLWLFPGGGATADVVRDWSSCWLLDDSAAHALAIHALGLNARLLATLLPGCPVWSQLPTPEQIATSPPVVIIDPAVWLTTLEQAAPDIAPPHLWDVTSDSLAAWLAWQMHADELILVKSIPVPRGLPVTTAVQNGWVDPYFPGLAGHIPYVSWCHLHETPPVVTPWLTAGVPR